MMSPLYKKCLVRAGPISVHVDQQAADQRRLTLPDVAQYHW